MQLSMDDVGIKRFIVCANRRCKKDDSSYLILSSPTTTKAIACFCCFVVLPVVVAFVVGMLLQNSTRTFDDSANIRTIISFQDSNNFSLLAVFAAIIILLLLRLLNNHFIVHQKDRMDVVFVYPTGIQLASVYVSRKPSTATTDPEKFFQSNVQNKNIEYGLFLPINEIVDCVVTEVLLAYKVVNVVAFRVRQHSNLYNNKYTKQRLSSSSSLQQYDKYASCENVQLVEAFPGASLTYIESLTIKNEMKKAIRRYSSHND